MNGSPNSQTSSEEPADLTQNQDEVMDLALGLGALGGLRHSRACDATQRSHERYDDRQHRLQESRMKRLGMEGDEKSPEDEDMSQQVLIRSPTIHHHYYAQEEQPAPPVAQPQPVQQPESTAKTWLKRAAIAALPLAGVGGTLAYNAMTKPDPPAVSSPNYQDTYSDVEAVQLYRGDQ